ncbi:MAG: hypothetical protein KDI01_11545 [Halioglobus sp.]|nr:hypothetical protein [Halioglobus sp.]
MQLKNRILMSRMTTDYPDGGNVSAAAAIKQVVDVPVMVVGRIHTPELAEQILASGQAELVALARPFLADPEWPDKARVGDAASIRQCISCANCVDTMIVEQNLGCAINRTTGRETAKRLAEQRAARLCDWRLYRPRLDQQGGRRCHACRLRCVIRLN